MTGQPVGETGQLRRPANECGDESPVPTRLPVGRAQTPTRGRRSAFRLLLAAVLIVSGGLFVAHIQRVRVVPSPSPAPGPCLGADTCRPYSPDSPWNTPIGSNPAVQPDSAALIAVLNGTGLPLTADADQYTIPVYYVDDSTPRHTVHLSGYFSSYDSGDSSRIGHGYAPTISGVPVPSQANQSAGTDGQIEIWDPATGVEYSFWQWHEDPNGDLYATNGYRYHTTPEYSGRFADGLSGRGAGTPYLAGLVRKWEVDRGEIDHALAFAYRTPSKEFVYPASKSDGRGRAGVDLPEGTRLQLDPSLTDADFDRWGLSSTARTVARALQRYGMYVIDNSGSSKVYIEDQSTAHWPGTVDRDLIAAIPWSAFRVVRSPDH